MSSLPARTPWHPILAGLSGSLVGIGFSRFAYAPLLPAIIAAGWFDAADAAYLGAANLAGYLAGALLAARLARRFATAVTGTSATGFSKTAVPSFYSLPLV